MLIKCLKAFGRWILLLIKKNLWYILLLIGSSIYVCNHWSNVNDFEKFNVANLIFVIWLLLLLLPLFSEMELFGIKLKKEVEKIKQETKEDVNELRRDIQAISIANQSNSQILNLSLPSKEDIKEAKSELTKENVAEPSKQLAEQMIKGITDNSVYLFQVRLVLEELMYKLAKNCGYNGEKIVFHQILHHLTVNEYLNYNIIENLKQVRNICNRGVHGEIVSDEYLDYVKDVFPVLVGHLEKAIHSSVSNYVSCRKCGYSGPSRSEYICPICKTTDCE